MDRFESDDVELIYEIHGRGEPVVLLHASAFVSWYRPLVQSRDQDFMMLSYRRRLREDATGGFRPLSAGNDAEICLKLMDQLDWPKGHFVGHSYGALVALEAALNSPERVQSIALLEPALRAIPSSAEVGAALQPVIAAYRTGNKAEAVDAFLRAVCGDNYRTKLENVVPDAFGEALAEADIFFQVEMPAVQQWSFGPSEAQRITRPVLNVVGAQSVQRFVEGGDLLQEWFPHAARLFIPDAGHLLMVENPTAVIDGLREFFSRHPIGDGKIREPLSS